MSVYKKLDNFNIILASGSPRRKELLFQTGLAVSVAPEFHADESYPDKINPRDVAAYIAKAKMMAYPYPVHQNDIVITADTVVIVEDKVLGKPADKAEAIKMIESLSGKEHIVVTAVVIASQNKQTEFSSVSTVKFRQLSSDEINYYVENFAPLDKAGAYGIQEWIGTVAIEHINGSFHSIMGLPVSQLISELEKYVTI